MKGTPAAPQAGVGERMGPSATADAAFRLYAAWEADFAEKHLLPPHVAPLGPAGHLVGEAETEYQPCGPDPKGVEGPEGLATGSNPERRTMRPTGEQPDRGRAAPPSRPAGTIPMRCVPPLDWTLWAEQGNAEYMLRNHFDHDA